MTDQTEGRIVVAATSILIVVDVLFIFACSIAELLGHSLIGGVTLAIFVLAFREGWTMMKGTP